MMKKNRLYFLRSFFAGAAMSIFASASYGQVLFNQDFSTGAGFTPPTGWTNVSSNTADPWSFDDDCGILFGDLDPGTTAMTGTIALLNSDCTEDDHNANLTTPIFDASLPGNYILEYDNSILNWDVQLCEVQVWNGTVWSTVYTASGVSDGGTVANHKSINITAASGSSTSAQVRFHYVGNYEYWWAIDNVKITRLTIPPPSCVVNISPVNNSTNVPTNPSIEFTWNEEPSATSYELFISEDGTPGSYFLVGTSTINSFSVFGFDLNTTYYWYVVPNNGILAAGCEANASSFTTATTVNNDECVNAISVSDFSTGSTLGASESLGDCASSFSDALDVWYSVTADLNGDLTITVQSAPNDIVLQVFSGSCNSPIACVDNYLSGEIYTIVGAVANATYFFRIYEYYGNSSNFSINVTGTALPVKMSNLAGKIASGNLAQLSWNTLTEQNNKGFEIQRSIDGKNFNTVGFVGSKAISGNSNEKIAYNFTDRDKVTGSVYYRLQQTDIDGKTSLSNVVRLSTKENGGFEVVAAPNPVKNAVSVKTYGVQASNATITVTDITGKVMSTSAVNSNETIIDMNNFAQGIYLIKYADAEHNETIKVSKQ